MSKSIFQKAVHRLAPAAYCRRTGCSPASCRFAAVILYAFGLGREFLADGDHSIREIARLLSTAYLIDPELAESLVDSLGGQQALFAMFRSQIPWTTLPEIEPQAPHGCTVRSNWYHAAEQHQADAHDAVCDICEILIGLSPRSDAAASDAVDPMGRPSLSVTSGQRPRTCRGKISPPRLVWLGMLLFVRFF